jgi:hypothetical protein
MKGVNHSILMCTDFQDTKEEEDEKINDCVNGFVYF